MQGVAPASAIVAMMSVCVFLSFACVHWVLSSWFARRIYGWQAFLLFVGIMGMMYFSIVLVVSGDPIGMAIPLVALMAGLVGRALFEWSDRRQRDAFDDEDIARYQNAIRIDPRNVAAHSLLADTWRRMGMLEDAIKEYEAALVLDPSLKPEKYWLEQCRTKLERRGRPAEMSCPRCGTPRSAGQPVCHQCGRVYSTWETWTHAFGSMAPAHRAVWSMAGAAAVTLLLAIGALVPRGGRLLLILGLFASSAIMLFAAYKDRRRDGSGSR